jgi:hypothetical protein
MELIFTAANKVEKDETLPDSNFKPDLALASMSSHQMRIHSITKSLLKRISQNKDINLDTDADSTPNLKSILIDSEINKSAIEILNNLLEQINGLTSYPSSLSDDQTLLESLTHLSNPLVSINDITGGNSASGVSSSGVSVSNDSDGSGNFFHSFNRGSDIDSIDGCSDGVSDGVSGINRFQFMACLRHRIERKEVLLHTEDILRAAIMS